MSRYIVHCRLDITDEDMRGLDELNEELRKDAVKQFVGCKLARFSSDYQIDRINKD